MNSLKMLSSKLAAPSNIVTVIFLIVAAFGFADASYLTAKHFLGTPINCSLLNGCEQVTNSPYSILFGFIPLALAGALYYLTVLIMTGLYIQTQNRLFFHIACALTIIGFTISAYLVYLQLFVIGAICLYCMGSATSSTILFITGLTSLKKDSNQEHETLN